MSRCIFCLRSNPSVTFSREHIIPHSLGGKLILRDYVCTHCNSNLGSDCDHEILNNPEILTAIEKLKLPHDRAKLINHNFKIRGLAVDGVELKGKATEDGFVFHPQSLPRLRPKHEPSRSYLLFLFGQFPLLGGLGIWPLKDLATRYAAQSS